MILFDLNPDVTSLLADAKAPGLSLDREMTGRVSLASPVASPRTIAARACRAVGLRFLAVASALTAEDRPLPHSATR